MNDTRPGFKRILILFLATRIALEIVGRLSMFYFPSALLVTHLRDLRYHTPQTPYMEMWARWDSEWWLMIAEKGYLSYDTYKDFGGGKYLEQETAKFFPAYPLGIRLLTFLTGNSVLSGILLANLAAIIFLYYLFRLGSKLYGIDAGERAAFLYILFPTGFFLSAVYSEPLFLATLAASFFYIEERKLLPAMIACALAMTTRSQAFLAAPALIWLAWIRFPERRVVAAGSIAFASGAALGAYLLFIQYTFGSIQWIPESIRYWRGDIRYPLYAFVRFVQGHPQIHGAHNSIIDCCFAVLNIAVLILSFKKIPWPYYAYSALAVLFPLSSTLFSFSRLCLANVPFFLYAGWKGERWLWPVLIASTMVQAFFMAAFANWFWVG